MWGVRPSELMGISDDYVAYCFDEAVGLFATHVRAELDKIEGKNAKSTEAKRKRKLELLLRDEDEPRRFANPPGPVTRYE